MPDVEINVMSIRIKDTILKVIIIDSSHLLCHFLGHFFSLNEGAIGENNHDFSRHNQLYMDSMGGNNAASS